MTSSLLQRSDVTGAQRNPYRPIVPLTLAAVTLLAAVPLLHPDDTCADWLMEWGRQASSPFWVPVHQLAMAGFLLAGIMALYLPLLEGRRTALGIAGGGALAGGFMLSALSYPIHATAISSLGQAFNKATSPQARELIQVMADSYIAYDAALVGVSTLLVSIGGALVVGDLWQQGTVSTGWAVVMVPLGGVWAAQRYHVFNALGFSLPEPARWACLCLWLVALGLLVAVAPNSPAGASSLPAGALASSGEAPTA